MDIVDRDAVHFVTLAGLGLALGMAPMARATPASSATTCSTTPMASNTYLNDTSDCGEEGLEENEERLEEELEARRSQRCRAWGELRTSAGDA